ncbi:right-handed parallel beta-helix repeat-containing protein [filamentous cyanobacterium LEGE 11480]|uniref:Right-handed parallel beta-helix repeat-containing protein n=1 Tax=Romeriopsis navalis LEGE 11480 TaxID=2777977 RepID=A0A928VGR3_9CYAN|nr:right-handed parallel beta-helix repeat-containing protein [Romeriopsis navalis]MBE9028311.1 right-handed parallel beta-helix repeat-containing protein [Romeriopsis navalis LEGE 11480]
MGKPILLGLMLASFAGCSLPLPTEPSTATAAPKLAHPLPTACQRNAPTDQIFMAPDGDDQAPGTQAQPIRTFQQAQKMVRDRRSAMSQNLTVYLRGGTYQLEQPLQFTPADGGRDRFHVIYRAFAQERPVISGGLPVKGWRAVGRGLYRAPVGKTVFRQFYVNGQPATRARTPNVGQYLRLKKWHPEDQSIHVKTDDLPPPNVLSNAEMVIQRAWNQSRLRIASTQSQGQETKIIAQAPERDRAFKQEFPYKDDNQAYHLENALPLLDAPGEWFLDTQQQAVFYKPRLGESIKTISAIAPQLETLIKVEGTTEVSVQNLAFCHLDFQHTTWFEPNQQGYVGTQAGIPFDSKPATSAIVMRYARQIDFENNVLQNLGGMGLLLANGTQKITVNANLIKNIADNGISIGIPVVDTNAPRERVSGHIIANNYITQIGLDYFGAAGIFAGYASGLRIEHNELTQLPYSAISVGWGWTDKDTSLKNNLIRYNHIHRVSQLLFDSGAIYTLSKQPGTVISHNYIHDMGASEWVPDGPGKQWLSGVYLDQGSSFIRVEHNVIRNVPLPITEQSVKPPAKHNQIRHNQGDSVMVKSRSGIQWRYRRIKRK